MTGLKSCEICDNSVNFLQFEQRVNSLNYADHDCVTSSETASLCFKTAIIINFICFIVSVMRLSHFELTTAYVGYRPTFVETTGLFIVFGESIFGHQRLSNDSQPIQ